MRPGPFLVLLFIIVVNVARAQDSVRYEVELQGIGTTNKTVPFWMRSNQYGSIPLNGASSAAIISAYKDYKPYNPGVYSEPGKNFDWSYGVSLRGNLGSGSNFSMIEGYGKLRYHIFQFTVGRTKDVMGLNGDTTLSSGNFAVSGNSLGIPKVEIAIPNYYSLPFFDHLFAFKGNFSVGYVGRARIDDTIRAEAPDHWKYGVGDSNPPTYFHQKSLYVKIGRPDWKLNLIGGFSHQVFYGSEKKIYSPYYTLTSLQTLFYVATGKTYGNDRIPRSKIGNQLGSVDFGVTYDFEKVKLMVYRQNIYDVGALSKLANIRDGLNGVTLTNKVPKTAADAFHWESILFELFYTKDQAGELNSIPTQSGDEDYYNNSTYLKGWTYYDIGIGNPFITPAEFLKAGQKVYHTDYYGNNRVVAFHFGIRASVKDINFIGKLSYSNNYGTYGTSPIGHSTGPRRYPPTDGIFTKVSETSGYLEASKKLKHRLTVGAVLAADDGGLLNNSVGVLVKVKRTF